MQGIEILDKITRESAISVSKAISKMTNKEIGVEFFNLSVRKAVEPIPFIGKDEEVSIVFMSIEGDISGDAFVVFPKESALVMSDLLQGNRIGTTKRLDKMGENALKEVGNVIAGCFLSVLSNKIETRLIESIPSYFFGAFSKMSNTLLKKTAEEEKMLVAEILFTLEPVVIKVYLLVLFKKEILSSFQ